MTSQFTNNYTGSLNFALKTFLDWCHERSLVQASAISRAILESYQRWLPEWKILVSTTTAGSLPALVDTTVFDQYGRVRIYTNQNNYTTSTAYGPGDSTSTVTFPDGGTKITTRTTDGTVLSVTGTAVVPQFYHISPRPLTEGGGFIRRTYIGEDSDGIAANNTADGVRWREMVKDFAGRTVITRKPAYNNQISETFYSFAGGCPCGQPSLVTSSGQPATIYEYNSVSAITRTGQTGDDLTLSLASATDRISRQENTVELVGSVLWAVSKSYVNAVAGSVAETLTSTSRTQLAGFTGNQVAISESIDVANKTTRTVEETNRSNRVSTKRTSFPGATAEGITTDMAGLVASERTPGSNTDALFTYDGFGRLLTSKKAGQANAATVVYAPGKNRPESAVDAHGVSTVYTYYIQLEPGAPAVKTTNTAGTGTQTTVYDLKGRITSTFGVRSYPVSYVYDPTYGELKTLTTWKDFAAQTGAAVTTWNYEARTGLLTSKVDPAAVSVTYTYDIASRILTRTDARNVVATFAYNNPMKDLTVLSYSDGTPTVTHSYDRLGRPDTTTTGTFARLVRTYEPGNLSLKTETTTYDSNGSGTFDAPDFTRTLTRQYDPTMITRGKGYTLTPSGSTVSEATAEYAFEPVAGRLLSASFPVVTGSAATGPAVFTYGYEPARPHLTRTVTAASHVVTNDWEPNRDVLDKKWNRYTTTVLSAYDYTVNAVGQRTEERVPNAATATWNWDYDALGQVKSADSPTAAFDQAYQYDDIGNRRKAVSGTLTLPGTDNYTANTLNQYTLIGSAVPSYDPVGNLINDAGTNWPSSPRTHVWDAENRLQQVKVTATNAIVGSYRYDAFHRRVSKTTGTSTTWFLYDGWNLIAEYTGTSNTLPTLNRTHYWGLDLSGSMQGAGGVGGLLLTDFKTGPKAGVYFPLYDGNGNVTSYLDFNHTPVAAYRYDAFGKLIWGAYSHVADFNIGFSTKYRDPETDFYYYGYRYYSAALGRWLNRDPIGEKGGLNLFGMVDNSPLDFIDTLGQGKYSRNVKNKWMDVDDCRSFCVDACSKAGKEFREFKYSKRSITTAISRFETRTDTFFQCSCLCYNDNFCNPGKFNLSKIDASGPIATDAERAAIKNLFDSGGCHHCGSKTGPSVADHQPPNALVKPGQKQSLYPQCDKCRGEQAGQITGNKSHQDWYNRQPGKRYSVSGDGDGNWEFWDNRGFNN